MTSSGLAASGGSSACIPQIAEFPGLGYPGYFDARTAFPVASYQQCAAKIANSGRRFHGFVYDGDGGRGLCQGVAFAGAAGTMLLVRSGSGVANLGALGGGAFADARLALAEVRSAAWPACAAACAGVRRCVAAVFDARSGRCRLSTLAQTDPRQVFAVFVGCPASPSAPAAASVNVPRPLPPPPSSSSRVPVPLPLPVPVSPGDSIPPAGSGSRVVEKPNPTKDGSVGKPNSDIKSEPPARSEAGGAEGAAAGSVKTNNGSEGSDSAVPPNVMKMESSANNNTISQMAAGLGDLDGNPNAAPLGIGIVLMPNTSVEPGTTEALQQQQRLSVPVIVGISAGSLLGVMILIGAAVFYCRQRRRSSVGLTKTIPDEKEPPPTTQGISGFLKRHMKMPKMDGNIFKQVSTPV